MKSNTKTVHSKIQPVVVKHVIKQQPPQQTVPQLELKVCYLNSITLY